MNFSHNFQILLVCLKEENENTHPVAVDTVEASTELATRHRLSQCVPQQDPNAATDLIQVKQESDEIEIKDEPLSDPYELYDYSSNVKQTVQEEGSRNSVVSKKKGKSKCKIKNAPLSSKITVDYIEQHGGFTCKICRKHTITLSGFLLHTKIHQMGLFRCKICKLACEDQASLIVHKRTHAIYKCELCDYRAIKNYVLVQHMKIHTGDKAHKCNLCEYAAATRKNLVAHWRTHTKVKPFHCTRCEYKCARKTSLNVHMMVHSDEVPYQCANCSYRSAQKRLLAKHVKIHMKATPQDKIT